MGRILGFFFYSLFLMIALPPLFPSLQFMFFAPFLVYCFYYKTKIECLWWALACGLIVDLIGSPMRLGVYALNYCLTVQLLYGHKRHFFQDSLSTLGILTFIFACLSTVIQASLLYAFGKQARVSLEWVKQDLLWMPLRDALYATLAFTLPSFFFPRSPYPRRSQVVSLKRD